MDHSFIILGIIVKNHSQKVIFVMFLFYKDDTISDSFIF